jgi:hypothetical protein
MNDERIDALIRRLDVPADPGSAFVDRTLAALQPRVRDARGWDGRVLGRSWAKARAAMSSDAPRTRSARPVAIAFVAVALLILALIATALLVGAPTRPWPVANGPLMISIGGDARVIDGESLEVRTILRDQGQGPIFGLSRSPDGRRISFWTGPDPGTRLEVSNVDGSGRRRLAAGIAMHRGGCIDDWSPDSRSIANEVVTGGSTGILVTDIVTDTSTLITPANDVAKCPLWSPDGRTIAFKRDFDAGSPAALAVIGRDGTGMREISGDLGGLSDYGANSWSPDGGSVYFGAGRDDTAELFRADVRTATSTRLTGPDLAAYGPALSPDGRRIAFMVWSGKWMDLYVMRSDGTDIRRLLEHAVNRGWSTDGTSILSEWHGAGGGGNGALVLVSPDGGEPTVLMAFAQSCPLVDGQLRCIDSTGWGQPQP